VNDGDAGARGTVGAPHEGLELTVLMPCLNEAETVGRCVAKAADFLARSGIAGEVLVADNGSTDGSQELARAAGARVVDVPERGYGAALIAGIGAARGRFIVMGDADDSYDFGDLFLFVEELRNGADLVMGNRFKGGIRPGAMPALHRYLGNPVLSFVGRLLFRTHVGDFHCGLRAFRRDKALALDLRTTGMEFASELVVKATLSSMRVVEVPTVLSKDGRSRPPHLRSWRDGWRHLRFLLLFSPRWLFFYPGLAGMVVGIAGLAVLGSGAWTPGRGRFSEGLLIAASGLVIAGVQAAMFALLAREFGATQGLLPPKSRRAHALISKITLEAGLVTATVCIVAAIAMLGVSLGISPHSDPEALEAPAAFRLGVVAVTLGVVGVQAALGSWFFSLLGLPRLASTTHESADSAVVRRAA
jgi:Glycosyl transferase family 2